MKLTAEEKFMYSVMKAIHDSKIPVSFKGSMVLKACLIEAGYTEDTRHTVDIDANWNSIAPPSIEQMVESLQNALKDNGIDLDVCVNRMFGEGRSAGFDLKDKDTDEILFSMDIDVNKPIPFTKIYEVKGVQFRGASSTQMIADKLAAISSDKVFRRIKDVVDLYYISKTIPFDKSEVLLALDNPVPKTERAAPITGQLLTTLKIRL